MDTAQNTLEECPTWAGQRRVLGHSRDGPLAPRGNKRNAEEREELESSFLLLRRGNVAERKRRMFLQGREDEVEDDVEDDIIVIIIALPT